VSRVSLAECGTRNATKVIPINRTSVRPTDSNKRQHKDGECGRFEKRDVKRNGENISMVEGHSDLSGEVMTWQPTEWETLAALTVSNLWIQMKLPVPNTTACIPKVQATISTVQGENADTTRAAIKTLTDFLVSSKKVFALSGMPSSCWVWVPAPLIPEVALVELPPMNLYFVVQTTKVQCKGCSTYGCLSRSRTLAPRSSRV
jgi:hypothetical protein